MSSENDLRCNNLECRAQLGLEGKAVVTGCSHIFCVPCANSFFAASQNCPACDQILSDPDDIVLSSLNPSNEYKASILSGLAPAVVLEVAVRAISFYQYQNSQEAAFQKLITKSAQEKLADMQRQLEAAQGALKMATGKISALEQELAYVNQKRTALVEETRTKDQDLTKLRAVCDRLKRKTILGPSNVLNAAVEEQIHCRQNDGAFSVPHGRGTRTLQSAGNAYQYGPPSMLSGQHNSPPSYETYQQSRPPRMNHHGNDRGASVGKLSGEYPRSNNSGDSPRLGSIGIASGGKHREAHKGFQKGQKGAHRKFGM